MARLADRVSPIKNNGNTILPVVECRLLIQPIDPTREGAMNIPYGKPESLNFSTACHSHFEKGLAGTGFKGLRKTTQSKWP